MQRYRPHPHFFSYHHRQCSTHPFGQFTNIVWYNLRTFMAGKQKPFPLLLLHLLLLIAVAGVVNGTSIEDQCGTEVEKLTKCVNYASGEAPVPTSDCCGSVTDVKGRAPACLCLVIRQAHNSGSSGVAGFHLRLDRLLSLPKACALTNSSVSYCPKLLNLPPNSPDYAIFTNASYANTSSAGSTTDGHPSGEAITLNNHSAFLFAAVYALFFLLFQMGA